MALETILRPLPLFTIAALLRLVLLVYGIWQDAHSALKYTDIDYLVFTDAARLVAQGHSPYDRATYRYTPLLAWLLAPTANPVWFSFGKIAFALADLLAGWFVWTVLREHRGMSAARAGGFAALWLWNPMVATISTRGSSEGLLGVLTAALLWAVERRKFTLAGVVLGLGVHFKIYPFIYGSAILWWMDDERLGKGKGKRSGGEEPSLVDSFLGFFNAQRIWLTFTSLATFLSLNIIMYSIYGFPFLEHTYLYHVTRIDHRHNFSPYNMLLYLHSADDGSSGFSPEAFAFVPQLLFSCVFIPLVVAKKDLATSMMAQTYAFVTFNKVCTSQYFLWYMIFLPIYLPQSSLLSNPTRGVAALALWVATQAAWLQQGYNLEFLGQSTFFPGLWLASLAFFAVNCWILGIIIDDGVGNPGGQQGRELQSKKTR